jgi:hypothetical protein
MHGDPPVASKPVAAGLPTGEDTRVVADDRPTVPADVQPTRKNTTAPNASARLAAIHTSLTVVTRLGCATAIDGSTFPRRLDSKGT